MRQVADISDEKVAQLTEAGFRRVGYDREVVGRASLAARVFDDANGLSRRRQVELWAFLTAPGQSVRMAKAARLRYRRLAAELGVTLADVQADEQASPVRVRLDFDRGTEVLRAA